MTVADNIYPAQTVTGMTILSRATGNKLGQVHDLLVDPVEGMLLGLVTLMPDGDMLVLDYQEISSFGPDAIMANNDDSMIPLEQSRLAGQPYAMKDLTGAKVMTEGGKLLGEVANVFVHLAPPPLAIYEIRESLVDKLLGRGMFIPASLGRAFSLDAERIIVPNETAETAADSLQVLADRELGPLVDDNSTIKIRVTSKSTPPAHD